MVEFILVIIQYVLIMLFLVGVALLGGYIGYRLRNRKTIRMIKYFKTQKKEIVDKGRLIAYMNRHYRSVYKVNKRKIKKGRDDEWLYAKCYKYALKCEKWEVNRAKAYCKRDLQYVDTLAMLVAIIGVIAAIINNFIWGISFLAVALWAVKKGMYPSGKHAYFLSVLEDVINDRGTK